MLRKCLSLLFAVLLLFGCGGGGGGGESSDAETETTSLKVFSESPKDGVTGVALNTVISAKMSEELDPASMNTVEFAVVQKDKVAGWVSLSGDVVSFAPEKDFQALSTCVVTLSGLKGKSGSTMGEPFVWAFVTGVAPDTTPPSVVASSPLNGAVVAVSATVSATFDEPIDPASLNSNTFAVTNTDTKLAVNGTLTLDGAGTKATFTPSANWDYSSHVGIKILGVKDLAGNAITTVSTWNFSTVAAPVVTTINLATADWVTYSKGGVAQATFDKVAGKVTVNIAGNSSDVSVRWAPLTIDKTKTYYVSFPCDSVPQRNIEVQLKQNGGTYHVYSAATVVCTGTVVIDMPTPDGDDPAGRLNINFGVATGVYTIGTVKVEYY